MISQKREICVDVYSSTALSGMLSWQVRIIGGWDALEGGASVGDLMGIPRGRWVQRPLGTMANLQLCQLLAATYLVLWGLLSEKELYLNSGQNRRRIYGGLTFFHLLTFQIGKQAQETELRGGVFVKPLKFSFANRVEFIWTLSLQSKNLISSRLSLCIPHSSRINRDYTVKKKGGDLIGDRGKPTL